MLVKKALEIINGGFVYKPGWTFEAVDHSSRYEESIALHITFPAQNSNADQAQAGYPESLQIHVEGALMVGECDPISLLRHILEIVIEIETHEAREFLRLNTVGYPAPFHPHRHNGILLWEATEPRNPALARALTYGVA